MKPKAIIFDMDGVILNSEPIYYEVQMKFFRELGINISADEYSTFVGLSQTEMWKRILKKFDSTSIRQLTDGVEYNFSTLNKINLLEELITKNNKLNYQHFSKLENLKPTPNLIDFINELKNKNIKLAVASSTTKKLVDLILEKLQIRHFFEVIVSGNEIKNGKPEPDIFLKTAELLKVKPEECIVIEDSFNGVKAAKSAGMKCIGFQKFNSGEQDLSDADLIVNEFNELISFI
ncbi:MAG TPA: HAD family phosphatase [Candidatus Cloacimonetes bacterium]|nr:HAD family phosphatase [Candidatus Cloacimonadota bacterium]